MHRVILLHADAPDKPAEGQACNGCGICCLSELCPLGRLLSAPWAGLRPARPPRGTRKPGAIRRFLENWQRRGACRALRWYDEERRYRCGALAEPRSLLPAALEWTAPLLARLARRYIAAGIGCDSSLQPERRAARR